MDRLSNINTLLAFVTVAREGSVSRAADVLNLTQPAISHQIKRLGQETGLTLFSRTPTGLQITVDGAALLPKAQRVIGAMTDFRRGARQRKGSIGGNLRIGTIIDPEFIRLGQMLSLLRVEYPDIATELVHGVSGKMLDGVLRGQLDAGFYLSNASDLEELGRATDKPLHAVRLADFEYKVIAPVGWQDRVEHADWAELVTLPWIGTPEFSVHHRLLAPIIAKTGRARKVVALVDQEASMLEMVRSGMGLSLCREAVALGQRQSYGLAVCRNVSVPCCLSFVTLDSRKGNPEIAALLGLLRSIW